MKDYKLVVSFAGKFYYYCLISITLLLLLFISFTSPAVADGGAPQLAYVAGTPSGISVIDIVKQHVTRTISEPGNPQTILLNLDGSALYVTQPSLGQVAVLEAKSSKTICSVKLPGQPSMLAWSLDYSMLFAAGQGDTSVRALNPQNCSIERTFQTREPVYGLAVTASTAANATPSTPNQIWITGSSSITIFDTTGHFLGTVPIAGGPQYISIPGGFTAYVTTREGTVVAVDLNSQRVIQTLLSGGQFGPMDYDAITGEVYVPDLKHNLLDVLAPIVADTTVAQQEPAQIIHLQSTPQSVAITSDGQLGFVALSNGQVIMLDIPSRKSITSISVGGTPHFIITGLYPPVNSPLATQQQTTRSSQGTQPATGTVLFIFSLVIFGILLLGVVLFIWRNHQKRIVDHHSAKRIED